MSIFPSIRKRNIYRIHLETLETSNNEITVEGKEWWCRLTVPYEDIAEPQWTAMPLPREQRCGEGKLSRGARNRHTAAAMKSQQRPESRALKKENHVQSCTRKSEYAQADDWNSTSPWTKVKTQWFKSLDASKIWKPIEKPLQGNDLLNKTPNAKQTNKQQTW